MVSSVGMGSFSPQMMWPKPPSFSQLDSNGDGSISLDELESAGQNMPAGNSSQAASRAQAFLKKVDTNGDGSISSDELSAFQSNMTSQMQAMMLQHQEQAGAQDSSSSGSSFANDIFSKIDADGDGSISEDELAKFMSSQSDGTDSTDQAQNLFNAIDTDGDGKISQSENDAFLAQRGQGHQGHHHHHGGGGGGSDPLSALINGSFNALDTNQDGVVSADELAAAGLTSSTTSTSTASTTSSSGTSSSSDTAATTTDATSSKTSSATNGFDNLLSLLYSQMDQNGDGQVTSDERQTFASNVQQAFAQWASNQYSSAYSLVAPDQASAQAA